MSQSVFSKTKYAWSYNKSVHSPQVEEASLVSLHRNSCVYIHPAMAFWDVGSEMIPFVRIFFARTFLMYFFVLLDLWETANHCMGFPSSMNVGNCMLLFWIDKFLLFNISFVRITYSFSELVSFGFGMCKRGKSAFFDANFNFSVLQEFFWYQKSRVNYFFRCWHRRSAFYVEF